MKKLLTLLLILALLLPVFGCDGSVPPETVPSTQPTDPQIAVPTTVPTEPEETTVPPETTEPPEITVAPTEPEPTKSASDADLYIDEHTAKFLPSEEELAASQFEAWWGASWLGGTYKYGYIGESGTITVPGGGLTIQLPEEWIPHLTIVWSRIDDSHWRLNISITELLRAVAAREEGIAPEDVNRTTLLQYMQDARCLEIEACREDTYFADDLREHCCCLGEDETYIYAAYTPECLERITGTDTYQKYRNILSEDVYYELLGDMIITEEMAREMITITGLIEE